MWTLSGEAMHKVWSTVLVDNGRPVMQWSQLADVTKAAWNTLAATVVNDVKKATGGTDDKISWILGMLSDSEKDRIYRLLYNMGCRIR